MLHQYSPLGSGLNLFNRATGFPRQVSAGAAASCGAVEGPQSPPGRCWLCPPAGIAGERQWRKQEYKRSWRDDAGLVDTEMLQRVKEYEIMMYVTCMAVLNRLGSLFMTQMGVMAIRNAFFFLKLLTAVLLCFYSECLYQYQLEMGGVRRVCIFAYQSKYSR